MKQIINVSHNISTIEKYTINLRNYLMDSTSIYSNEGSLLPSCYSYLLYYIFLHVHKYCSIGNSEVIKT